VFARIELYHSTITTCKLRLNANPLNTCHYKRGWRVSLQAFITLILERTVTISRLSCLILDKGSPMLAYCDTGWSGDGRSSILTTGTNHRQSFRIDPPVPCTSYCYFQTAPQQQRIDGWRERVCARCADWAGPVIRLNGLRSVLIKTSWQNANQ
jgi:hypothetical protein